MQTNTAAKPHSASGNSKFLLWISKNGGSFGVWSPIWIILLLKFPKINFLSLDEVGKIKTCPEQINKAIKINLFGILFSNHILPTFSKEFKLHEVYLDVIDLMIEEIFSNLPAKIFFSSTFLLQSRKSLTSEWHIWDSVTKC